MNKPTIAGRLKRTEPNSEMICKSYKTIIANNAGSGGRMDKRSLEKIARRRHRRDKSTIDHLADKMYAPKPAAKDFRQPTTDQGLSIEGQVRKKWNPKKGGLPIF
jgi:hypothetical protein